MFRESFMGFVRLHILHHAAEEPVYGLDLIEELAREGCVVDGRKRTYYSITDKGQAALAQARPKIAGLVDEVLEQRDGEPTNDT